MAGPGKRREQSLLQRMLKSLVKVPSVLRSFGSLIFSVLTDTRSGRFTYCVVLGSVRTSMATQLEQFLYTSSIITAFYATDSRSKKRFRVEGGGIPAPSVFRLDRLSDRTAHCIN